VQLQLGDTQAALTAYQQYFEISKRLAAADSSNTQAQRDLSASYSKLGNVQLQLGDTQAALTAYQQALEIRKRLAAADPSNTQVQRELSVSYNKVGRVQEALEDTPTALETQRQGLIIAQELAKHDEKNADVQNLRLEFEGVIQRLEGDEQIRLNNFETALQKYQQALTFSTQVVKNQPNNLDAKNDVILNYDRLGWLLFEQKQHEKALDYLRQAQAASHPAVPKDITSRLAIHLSEVLWVTGKKEEAQQILDKALQQFPDDKKLQEVFKRLEKK